MRSTWTSGPTVSSARCWALITPSALSAANNLAVDLRLVGDCFRARDIDLDTLSQRERVLGPDHPNTLHSASMLARDLREAGEYRW